MIVNIDIRRLAPCTNCEYDMLVNNLNIKKLILIGNNLATVIVFKL